MHKYLLATAIAMSLPAGAYAAQEPAKSGCMAAEAHQFDFWVGRWNVYRKGSDKQVANSRIESLYGGCAVRENWMPFRGSAGGSLNAYSPQSGKWRQFWADGDGSSALFAGGWNGTAMVLTGVWPQPDHPDQITRMTFTPQKDGSVEQFGETSDDGGKTWQAGFDLIYRPAAS